ncbi:MAG: bifunctional 5,10-methylene-tetrahydrofolate dehydrogenase/5,10-methylene-tetrahydrofolate cyclohydrolase, partial [Clostridia bacterium]|nr:bifunctional 5,10-methylene-tetrahydrofolate dehydrogenase/5,10-methylene-tetrahydrofolate cyclohydrolase [Clostridia bacterium]
MAVIIDGKAVAAKVRAGIKEETEALIKKGKTPGLAVVIVGNDQASRAYVNNKEKACAEVGIRSEEYALPEETTEAELLALVDKLNKKDDVDGILVQMPVPKQI